MATTDTDWLQRRRKRIRCKKHGLHYDPSLTSGCVLCRKEGTVEEPREGAKLVPLLLSLLGLVIVAWQLSSAEFSSEIPPTSRTRGARVVHLTNLPGLDAEPFRESIEAVEEPLFEIRAEGFPATNAAVVEGLERLASALESAGSPPADLAPSVRELAAGTEITEAGYEDLIALRNGWVSLRRRAFEPEVWFESPRSEADRAAVLAWLDASRQLSDLLRETSDRLVRAPDTAPAEESTPTWSGWTAEVGQRLDSIRAAMPARPGADADERLLASVLDLEQGLRGSESAIEGEEPAPETIDSLLATAERAQRGFERLLAG